MLNKLILISNIFFDFILFRYDFLAPNKDALQSQYRGENVEGKIFKSRRYNVETTIHVCFFNLK